MNFRSGQLFSQGERIRRISGTRGRPGTESLEKCLLSEGGDREFFDHFWEFMSCQVPYSWCKFSQLGIHEEKIYTVPIFFLTRYYKNIPPLILS